MEEIVNRISELRGVEIKKETSSWFNGHGYFPLHTYELDYEHEGWRIKLTSEWRVSEFVRSNKNAGDPFSSVFLWTINASRSGLNENYEFTVEKESWIRRLTHSNGVSVKSNSDLLNQHLRGMRGFEDWFVADDYPIDNVFNCSTANGLCTIFTTFSTEFNPEAKIKRALEMIEHICWKIEGIEKEKTHNNES